MSRRTLAIIGSGISGMSAAHAARHECDIHIFEKDERVGGHASTVDIPEGERMVGVDTGFMVCNPTNYPKLFSLFEELGVAVHAHQGGFNFFDMASGDAFGSAELEADEAYIKANYTSEFYDMWLQAERLHAEAPRHLLEGKCFISMRDYLDAHGYTEAFINGFLVQVSCSYWSLPIEEVLNMPASTLLGFFVNHGKDGLGGKGVAWHSVVGGSKRYMEALQKRLERPVAINTAVKGVKPASGGGVLVSVNGEEQHFDACIIATHADQALGLLSEPTELQYNLLSQFRYNPCETVLHTDDSVLPCARERWASWNYGRFDLNGQTRAYLVYHMNQIQALEAENDYFVSLDSPVPIDPAKIIKTFAYEHPLLDMNAYRAQKNLNKINKGGPIYFAGSYFSVRTHGPDFAGFHESGIASGQEAAKCLMKDQALVPA